MTCVLANTDASGAWSPGIGDPTLWGWLIVAAYGAAAALAWRAWRLERRAMDAAGTPQERALRRPIVWLGVCAVLLALGINKQLDLQTYITELGRRLALAQGWYERRRMVQAAFVAAVGVGGVAAGVAMLRWLGPARRRYLPVAIGLAMLLAFIVVRAASFHHIDDALFRMPIVEAMVNRGLELGGIAFLGWCAWRVDR